MVGIPATVVETFVARCRQRALTPDPRLRLLAHRSTGGPVDRVPPRATASLGEHYEQLLSADARTAGGVWYTPGWLARRLTMQAIDHPMTVADPSCGGGAFLLAAADRLHALGADPTTVVGELLWGADIDPVAIAVAEAELWLWSAALGEPAVAGSRLVVGDALVDVDIPPTGAVVGNPPFLGQLRTQTSADAARRRALTHRWGDSVRPYTDAGWLFLLAAVESVQAGGVVALVQPQSVLGARDADAIRRRIDTSAVLEDCWVDDGSTFAAAVDVCAPVLRRVDRSPGRKNEWLRPLTLAGGVPDVALDPVAGTLGDRATVVAGFRDEYYGLVDAVAEGGGGPRLVTSGRIDPLRLVDAPVRFAKRRWAQPTVQSSLASGRAVRWIEAQAGPKIVVASQTRIIEAVVDTDGTMVASVPALVVRPHGVTEIWHLAAALHAPVVSAWMLGRTLGTGLSSDACRPTANLVSDVPLPAHRGHWDHAADLARRLADGENCWGEFAVAADSGYGVDDRELRDWWSARVPLR